MLALNDDLLFFSRTVCVLINRFVAYNFTVWLKIIKLLTGATLLALANLYIIVIYFFYFSF